MDVTSMLNTSSVAAEQSPKAVENPKMPIRSRTPWDAGGYSLPINTRSIPFTEPISCNESPATPLKSPRESSHRPSDSHSSMSSYASSIHSTPHSRFSSTSTVSGFYPLNNIITDDCTIDRRDRCSSRPLRSPLSAVSPSSLTMVRNSSLSPAQPLEVLAQIPERQFSDNSQSDSYDYPRRGSELVPVRPLLRGEARTKSVSCLQISRPSSPSDAILIKRTTQPIDPVLRESSESSSATPPAHPATLEVPEQSPGRLGVHTRRHKRAVSAPDFPGMAAGLVHGSKPSTSVGPNAELTPPSSQHPDHASPGASMLYTAPNTPPETSGNVQEEQEETPRCMYIADCDTGSQPRKAVSHIFGRNKMCTRLIPKMVWVYYCRKHYQRTRYRNAKEYVKLQYDLVAQQIKRLQDWSQDNIRTGQGGVVKDWSIAVRKREQKRLDDQKAKGSFDNEDSGDDDSKGTGSAATATAVPQWLLDQCGRGYSTAKLMEIVNRLGDELMNGTVSVFPDIEILPNIIVDQEEAEEPKGYAKRKATSSHQRSQSLSGTLRCESYPRSRSMSSQPSMAWPPNTAYNQAPLLQKKRKRFEDQGDDYGSPTSQNQRTRVADYPLDTGRRGPFGHRPAFPNISEHQGYESEYAHPEMHSGYYHQSNTPLPAPTPQRYPSQSMASQLESYGQSRGELRRPMHKRSQSDMSALYNSQPAYRFPPRHDDEHLAPPQQQHYDEQAPRRYYSPPGFYTNPHPHPNSVLVQHNISHGHMRHQSTPLLARQYAPHEASPRFGNQRQMALPPPGHLIMEAPQGKILYSERR